MMIGNTLRGITHLSVNKLTSKVSLRLQTLLLSIIQQVFDMCTSQEHLVASC